jgi:hypothetical protein
MGARTGLLVGAVATVGIAWVVACTGDNPDLESNPSADAGAGTDSSSLVDGSTATSDASSDATIDPKDIHPLCPRGTLLPCGTGPDLAGAALHLDACTLGESERYLGEWKAVTSQALSTAPAGGALYCRGAFGSRPGVKFSDSRGFTLPSPASDVLNYGTSFTVLAVMDYVVASQIVPGSIVFQRNIEDAENGFPGPQLIANLAYPGPGQFGTSDIDGELSCKGIGMQLQYGPKDGIGGGVSAATDTHRVGPLLVVGRIAGGQLELRINGKSEKIVAVPNLNELPNGSGQPLKIGYAGGANNAFNGTLSEIVFYTSDVPNLTQIEDGLLAKWGIQKAQ